MVNDTNLPAVREKIFGNTTIEELTGVKSGGDVVLVNVNRATLVVDCWTRKDFIAAASMSDGVRGAVWNEAGITLVMNDRYTGIRYAPEIHPLAAMFFKKQSLNYGQWTGEFEPVSFNKVDLLRFLKTVDVVGETKDLIEAIKSMKLQESRKEHDTISMDDDKTTSMVEETFVTNIPKKFSLMIPVTPDFTGKFDFEATAERPSERGSRSDTPGKKMIVLRCTNPTEILRGCMQSVLEYLPPELPRLYGKMEIKDRRERW